MARRRLRGAAALLVAFIGLGAVAPSGAWAGACDDPTDTSPHPRQIPGCKVVKLGPYGFDEFQHTYWNASCPAPNSLFLGNDEGYVGDSGYELDNNCFSTWSYTPRFDNQFEALVINWCDKHETVNLSLGCMPGN